MRDLTFVMCGIGGCLILLYLLLTGFAECLEFGPTIMGR